jgi:hypothetical protein
MFAKSRWFVLGVLLVGVAVGLVLHQASSGFALAQRGGGKGGTSAAPHYTVVMTEGHNLIVTDNQKNVLYFYTTNKDEPIGSPLHLRGSADLSEVGGSTITPHKSAAFKGGAK